MSYAEFVELVRQLRSLQRDYFMTRSTLTLFACKEIERKVDAELSVLAKSENQEEA